MARSAPRTERLDVGPHVAAVLRPEETARLRDLRNLEHVVCAICGEWIEPDSSTATSVSISVEGERVAAEFAHAECAPSHADLASLVMLAQAEPLGIVYAQALHPDAGAVLLWERKLDVRVRGLDGGESSLYLDADRWEGFHVALVNEPVRLLAGWLLERDGDDLVLRRDEEVERFHGAIGRSTPEWLGSLEESGFCMMIVGAGVGLELPRAASIQAAIREHRALMGLVEFDV
ncbi:MAG: hypothetical protein JO168_25500 [Solirubrobacterales bacterium]|nr:hypothetical protein [Solirubrobacterales bacterium]MBV9714438.1 hypothetical protein [Solirubrobacterales bacterium]